MAINISSLIGWVGRFGGSATSERTGRIDPQPMASLVTGVTAPATDSALQVDTVWACVDRRASVVSSLPLFVYERMANGQKDLARASSLWALLHDSPNTRMTPSDFWRAMLINYDLRGNAYARIERRGNGEAYALWPMPADQVTVTVLDDGAMVYVYRVGSSVSVLSEENVLHLRNLGNGTTGLDKLSFMRASIAEVSAQTQSASTVWGSSGKPTGVLMIDRVLKPEQRAAIQTRFSGMASGSESRLYILEAEMKYQQLSITPEQQQLLESRQFSVEQMCRWYDVPPVLVHHANVTTWGSGIEQIVDGFYKLSIRPLLVAIEQQITKRVLTPQQRVRFAVEFSLDALLRGNAKDRATLYATNVQNGIMTRNEARQLENLPPVAGADELTAQVNLSPVRMLGANTQGAADAAAQTPVA